MPCYHIVLMKLKPSITPSQITAWSTKGAVMVGQIPGLLKWNSGPPLEITKHRTQGFDYGLVAVLEKAGDVQVYAEHPAHKEVQVLRLALCTETIAYDVEIE
ncbi:hypothetical protein M409DRAFT_29442 [Zasmidium cellare ATCC 36951]|uniref:Stress-response A/B barrel domain-containing protein n=1 Tax=Zasmidium cellare ATCC 36951 TaxID=1080233 RepID=A0A6A6BZB5_ZASCE|nr:uncharacterized protein M409DRAFT_29442 [Zasmidium cellare ATCC 36951]KAF2160147.1 hypothetical protein M409DRAFT_29442 [Zasmidium cellare ATCC 36951]